MIPVWSLKALEGIDRPEEPDADPPPLPEVVVVDDELVELQATAVIATTATIAECGQARLPRCRPQGSPLI